MSFVSKFPNLYKGPYPEELVAEWPDIVDVESVQHPYPRDAFYVDASDHNGKLRPTHYKMKVPPNSLVVYYPHHDEHTIFSHFRPGELSLYLGELLGTPSRGVFVDREGKVRDGYHLWQFRLIPHNKL